MAITISKTEVFNLIENIEHIEYSDVLEIFVETYHNYDYLVEDAHNYLYLDSFLEY